MSGWTVAVLTLLSPLIDLDRTRLLVSPRMKAELAACSMEVARDRILVSAGGFLCSALSEGPANDVSSQVMVLARSSGTFSQQLAMDVEHSSFNLPSLSASTSSGLWPIEWVSAIAAQNTICKNNCNLFSA